MSTPARVQVSRTCCLSVHAEPGEAPEEKAGPQLSPHFTHWHGHEGSWKFVAIFSESVPLLSLYLNTWLGVPQSGATTWVCQPGTATVHRAEL